MGDAEILINVFSSALLSILVYNIINILTFKDFIRRFSLIKLNRRDFYECGFKPQTQKPVRISIQFMIICVFFLLYDIELIFVFPFVSSFTFMGLYDTILISMFFFMLLVSLIVDYERHALVWQD